jgi:hypothetical protein
MGIWGAGENAHFKCPKMRILGTPKCAFSPAPQMRILKARRFRCAF